MKPAVAEAKSRKKKKETAEIEDGTVLEKFEEEQKTERGKDE